MHCLLFGFVAISVHAFVVMFMHQLALGVPQPMQDAAAPAWRSASRKAESRHPQSRTMEVPPVGRKVETLDESAHARERDDFAALRKDMRQLISRLSQHLDHVEQPRTAPRAAAAETPAAAAREPEPVQSAAGVAATLRTDKVGLALAQAVQAMTRDAMRAEDAGRTEDGVERPATAAASRQPRLEQLTARLARAEAEAKELGELQARAEAGLREVEAAEADWRRAQRRVQGQAEAAASAAGGATDSVGGAAGAAGTAGTTLEQLLETLRAQRPAASPKPTAAAAQPAAAKPLPAKPAAAAPRRKPKKEKEDNWEDEWEKEDQEASSVESTHTSLTAEVQAMLAKLMGDGGAGGGGRGESKASAKKKKGRKAEQPKGERAAQEDGAQAAREQTGAKGQAESRARADEDDFEVHDLAF